MNNHNNPVAFQHKRRLQDTEILLQYIVSKVESGTGSSLHELKDQFPEDKLFLIGLRHVTTTKKTLCAALNIPVENACRYKRKLEKNGQLVQSAEKVVCPYTQNFAHLISTNPSEFDKLKEMEL